VTEATHLEVRVESAETSPSVLTHRARIHDNVARCSIGCGKQADIPLPRNSFPDFAQRELEVRLVGKRIDLIVLGTHARCTVDGQPHTEGEFALGSHQVVVNDHILKLSIQIA
jgi:hypothetical protein